MMKSITDTLEELEAEASACDERAVQLRTAAAVLKSVSNPGDHPVKRAIAQAAKPAVITRNISNRALEDAMAGKTLGEIPLPQPKPRAVRAVKTAKRKYVKKAAYWGKKAKATKR